MQKLLLALLAAALTAPIALATAGTAAVGAVDRGVGFDLRRTSITPDDPLFDGKREATLHYGFAATRDVDLRVRVVRVRGEQTVRTYTERAAEPGRRLERPWNGLDDHGHAVDDGRYEFRVGPKGGAMKFGGRFRFHTHVFPVDGSHGTRGAIGEFHAPRSGGRIHEGFDITGDCGTRLVAARGGTVKKVGYDPVLYGNYVLIDGRKSNQDYFYAHLIATPAVGRRDRVRTGQYVGRIGRTGNAATTPCHLHFEIRVHGHPVDPEPYLRRWDGYS